MHRGGMGRGPGRGEAAGAGPVRGGERCRSRAGAGTGGTGLWGSWGGGEGSGLAGPLGPRVVAGDARGRSPTGAVGQDLRGLEKMTAFKCSSGSPPCFSQGLMRFYSIKLFTEGKEKIRGVLR